MDPKKKRIYLILIVSCVVASGGVFLWGRGSGGGPSSSTPVLPGANTSPALPSSTPGSPSTAPVSTTTGAYPVPSVFPASNKLDTTILDSSDFTTLQPYSPIQLNEGELGREDPFKNY